MEYHRKILKSLSDARSRQSSHYHTIRQTAVGYTRLIVQSNPMSIRASAYSTHACHSMPHSLQSRLNDFVELHDKMTG